MITEEEFISGVICGNPGCETFVPRIQLYHQFGMRFEIWQCQRCGWIRELHTPEIAA